VTTKPSIRKWGVLYKSGVYARKVLCLTPGDLHCALGGRVRPKLAESAEGGLTAGEKSAEGKLVLPKGGAKARTVSPRGDEKRGREPA
jgi:hypothetical protein